MCSRSQLTSASGQSEKSERVTDGSALPLTPDIALHRTNRRDVPEAELTREVEPVLHRLTHTDNSGMSRMVLNVCGPRDRQHARRAIPAFQQFEKFQRPSLSP
jgi:hypothetical protein